MKINKHKLDKWLIKHDYVIGMVLLAGIAIVAIGFVWLIGEIV